MGPELQRGSPSSTVNVLVARYTLSSWAAKLRITCSLVRDGRVRVGVSTPCRNQVLRTRKRRLASFTGVRGHHKLGDHMALLLDEVTDMNW